MVYQISKKAIKELDVADWENINFAVGLYMEESLYTMPSANPEWVLWAALRKKLDTILVEKQEKAEYKGWD